ncbi:rhodanese-like domain-containing protein [Candidatus Oscillochloris fontis]|uniref:rhodanese-like domain-containing protein n=1 Tax=Candidatus Oscillochloris fontis TaxID=2496868 RepID=UPI0015842E63|nr:rhodanese-like domain-containing protein [Candidatus Oscillochloris fontis]
MLHAIRILLVLLIAVILAACGATTSTTTISSAPPAAQSGTLTEISVADLKVKLDANESLFLVDVRTPAEFTQDGHVAQSTLIPLDQLTSRLAELPTDTPIYCICRSGNRSTTACNDLRTRGYTAINVSGGMIAWKAAGLPVAMP